MFKEKDIWWLSRIVEHPVMSTGLKENLIIELELNTVPCTGPLIEAGTTLRVQAK